MSIDKEVLKEEVLQQRYLKRGSPPSKQIINEEDPQHASFSKGKIFKTGVFQKEKFPKQSSPNGKFWVLLQKECSP